MKVDSYWSYFTDKQGDNSEFMRSGVDTVCPVRVQAKSGVAQYTIELGTITLEP
jgi:hypothetical protein